MNMSRKTMAVLLLLFVGFTAGTILVRNSGEKETAPKQEIAYYLTAYDSGDDILAVAVENETGSLTVVHANDAWFTDTKMPGIEPDIEAASQLFESVSTIRMNGRVDGADPADPQFGLDHPAATILVEDQTENGIQFRIGAMTPDEKAYYACAAGGTEVFTLSADYAQAFLGDVRQYLDLAVMAGTDLSKVASVTVADEKGTRFSLAATGAGNVTGMKYYSLTEPVRIPLAASLTRENIFTPMEEMRAQTVVQKAAADTEKAQAAEENTGERDPHAVKGTAADADEADPAAPVDAGTVLTLKMEDGSAASYLIGGSEKIPAGETDQDAAGGEEQALIPVTDMAAGVAYLVPSEQLEWLEADAAQILGGKLLSLNAGATDQIILEAQGKKVAYSLSGSGKNLEVAANGEEMAAADFTARILDSLNHISVQMAEQDSSGKTEEVLRCTILTGKGEETTQLVFAGTKDRKCLVSVNDAEVFECDRSSLQPLIEAAAGA